MQSNKYHNGRYRRVIGSVRGSKSHNSICQCVKSMEFCHAGMSAGARVGHANEQQLEHRLHKLVGRAAVPPTAAVDRRGHHSGMQSIPSRWQQLPAGKMPLAPRPASRLPRVLRSPAGL